MDVGLQIFYMICFGLANMGLTFAMIHSTRMAFDTRAFAVWLGNGSPGPNYSTYDRVDLTNIMTGSILWTLVAWGVPEIIASIIDGALIANGVLSGPVAHVTLLIVYLVVGGPMFYASYEFYRNLPNDVSTIWHRTGELRQRYASNEAPVTQEQLYNERKARKRKAASMSLFVRNRKTKRIEVPGRKILR